MLGNRSDIDLDEPMIGERVRVMRHFRHKTLTEVAGLAAISPSYLSLLERGLRPLDSRQLLYRLADALQCSVAELTGEPTPATSSDHAAALATVQEVRLALAELEHPTRDGGVRPLEALEGDANQALKLFMACHYADSGRVVVSLLEDLGRADIGDEARQRRLLAARVRACFTAWCLVTSLGYLDLALRAAELASQYARQQGDPVLIGCAEFARSQALYHIGAARPSLAVATSVADEIEPHLADNEAASQAYGMLRVHAAQTCAVVGTADATWEHLGDAATLAGRLGEHTFRHGSQANVFELYFGPANVELWRLAIAVELHEGGRAPKIVAGIDQSALVTANRRGYMYADLGRGLAQERGQDRAAVEALCEAERIAPQLVRTTPLVRETVTDLLRRARRRAGGRNLTGLAYRMGLIHQPVQDV